MGLDAFVQRFYVKSGWTEEESLLAGHGFESGAIEGWTNPHCFQREITIARFATSMGAQGQLEDLTSAWRRVPKPARVIFYTGGWAG
jgi:hypothetical protein